MKRMDPVVGERRRIIRLILIVVVELPVIAAKAVSRGNPHITDGILNESIDCQIGQVSNELRPRFRSERGQGKTGCMVYVDSEGNVSPLYLKDLQDPTTGKIPPRLVDIKSDRFTSVVENILNAITPADYEAAKKYVANPEEFDFHKILNWK